MGLTMETLYRGGREVGRAGVGDSVVVREGAPVALASVMTGATAGLVAYVLRAPLWGALLVGAGGALVTKLAIDGA